MSRTYTAVAIATVIAIYCVVGGMDYEDEQAEASYYAEMVCGGYWPDYENLKPECNE